MEAVKKLKSDSGSTEHRDEVGPDESDFSSSNDELDSGSESSIDPNLVRTEHNL